ncbi:MAG: hypothetical protein AAFO75_02715 [Pseudomonadota bacterium]
MARIDLDSMAKAVLMPAVDVRARAVATVVGGLMAACVLSACGGGTVPFGGSDSKERLFVSAAQTWDLNKDNKVTCSEWKQYTGELFTLADGNQDGVVGNDEYARIVKADRLFQSASLGFFDTNGDGKLTAQEFTETKNPAFDSLDRNKDCQIASEEMVRTRGIAAPPPSADTGPPTGGGPGGPGGI